MSHKIWISLSLLFFTLFCFACFASSANAVTSNLKISGYIQPQWQLGQSAASLEVGKPRENNREEMFNRLGVRRGRLKVSYDDGKYGSGAFQFNVIDKPGLKGAQIQIKELYVHIRNPFGKIGAMQAGVFNRPFGFEINYSTSQLESPERALVINKFFPDECDLGGMIILQPDQDSWLHFMTLQGGLFAGNGINPETDNRKDFIGQLVANKFLGNDVHVGVGVSYYHGGIYQSNDSVYRMEGSQFVLDANAGNKGGFAKREYIGVDAQLAMNTFLGKTQLRGEYVFGTHPGTYTVNAGPSRAALPSFEDTYIRPASGGYVMLVQDIGNLPLSAVVKYDVYDPNTAVAGNQVGAANTNTGIADIQYNTLGAGVYWQISPDIRTTVYYEFISNETSTAMVNTDFLKNYARNRKDNVLTFRMQYQF